MGSLRKISTAAGSLGGKCGAPTYGVVVASMVAQDTNIVATTTSRDPFNTVVNLSPTQAAMEPSSM
jgi:hypothetical protein